MYSKADAFIVCTCTQVHTPVHSHWYDRQKLIAKEIHNTQYVACMNPTAGSFTINPRLQRHFSVFAISFPGQDALHHIYTNILSQHLQQGSFASQVRATAASSPRQSWLGVPVSAGCCCT